MSKPATKKLISGPLDARHVGGVSIPGVTVPIPGIVRAATPLEPDTTPSHTFAATGNIEIPRRSNSFAYTLSRPSLRLKTSLSLLKGRQVLNSLDPEQRQKPTEGMHTSPLVGSLRKRPSTSKLWQRTHHDVSARECTTIPGRPESTSQSPVETTTTTLARQASVVRFALQPTSSANPYEYHPQLRLTPTPHLPPATGRKPSLKKPFATRPKRADSGTTIDFDDIPIEDRPPGFKEILARSNHAERMALYKKTRDYWASADHGLEEWVERAGSRRPVNL